MFKYVLYKIALFFVHYLPYKVSYKIAIFLSNMHYWLSFKDRKAVIANLRVITGKENVTFEAKEVFRNFGRYLHEFFIMDRVLDKDYIRRNIKIKNIRRIQQVLDKGKGGILVTAHIGNWELGGVIVSILGYPLTAVALPHKERPVNDLFNSKRQSKGIKVAPLHNAVRMCMSAIKRNELIALVADRDFSSNGEVMDFLGKKAFIPKGAAVLSRKTGAPIIPAFLIRKGIGQFTLFICNPIFPDKDFRGNDEVKPLIRKYLSVIEDMIRRYPSQWLMFRRFWI